MFQLAEHCYCLIQTLVFLLVSFIILFVSIIKLKKKNSKSAFIVVLGDLGRSPRMNYHCLSLVKIGFHVTLIGYKESKQLDEVENNSNISIVPLSSYPQWLQCPQLLQYIMKTLYLCATLLICLMRQKSIPKFVLVQNPPSIPTLGLVYVYTRLVSSKFIIDWHNYGYTILALKSGPKHVLVKLCKQFEKFFGQRADASLCVTQAMRDDLKYYFNIEATTMYDKAHERFKELTADEKKAFYSRLADHYELSQFSGWEEKSNRPALIVSSSSWTEDEDFHILVEALETYQNEISNGNSKVRRDIVCILTGKGPLKKYYQDLFEKKKSHFKNIQVVFLWLDPNDYPCLLGSADLGICFHNSTSNLDLPMKVVDFFGVRLPVCALRFACIHELVKENRNGLVFDNSRELADQLIELLNQDFDGDAKESTKLFRFRKNLVSFSNWNEEWTQSVEQLFRDI